MTLAERIGIDPSLFELWDQLDGDAQAATACFALCHAGHGINLGKDKRLAMRWWSDYLPERVTLAALTSGSLREFVAELASRLKGQIGGVGEQGEIHRLVALELFGLPEDRQRRILDVLERQASVCVTIIRASQDARKKRGEEKADSGVEPVAESPGLFDGDAASPESVPGSAAASEPAELPL